MHHVIELDHVAQIEVLYVYKMTAKLKESVFNRYIRIAAVSKLFVFAVKFRYYIGLS